MPDLQTQITGPDGRYRITELPPGDDYVVHFYYGTSENPSYSRSGIRLGAGKTIVIDARLSSQGQAQVQVIRETAPSVDVANATSGIEINEELLRQMPLRGRNYQSSLFLAPGAADVAARNFNKVEGSIAKPGGDVGVSISGATGAENAYLIDGVNVTDPGLGVLSSELSQYFIKEIQLLTGGYQAEYGRAMGGIVSVVTKSGGNQLHGGVYQSWAPFQATAPSVARLGEAISRRVRPDLNTWDLAFDLGGALLRDRIWFYTGLAVTSVSVVSERSVRRQVFDGLGPRALPDFSCPSYLADSRFCDGPSALAKETQELGNTQRQTQTRSTFNPIAKLQFHLRPDHDLFLSYFGAPNVQDTFYECAPGKAGIDLRVRVPSVETGTRWVQPCAALHGVPHGTESCVGCREAVCEA